MKRERNIYITILIVLLLALSTNIYLHDITQVKVFIYSPELKEFRWYYYDMVTLISTGLLFLVGVFLVKDEDSFLIHKIMLTGVFWSILRTITYVLFGLIYDHYFIAFLLLDLSTYILYKEIKKALD